MDIPRRHFLRLSALAAVLPGLSGAACAQTYPMRPVRIVTGGGAGGGADLVVRLMAQRLSERLGQSFVIENRPGAGGNIATELVVRAPADGHSLLTAMSSHAINATLYENLSFNFIRDIAPVASFIRQPYVMLVSPTLSARTVPEFIAHAKGNPGKLNMASPGIGTGPHMAGELFEMMANIDMVHVPYRGAQVGLADLIAGQVQVSFHGIAASIDHIRNGVLRPLAVTSSARSGALPDVPTIGEFIPGYEASTWVGLGAPKNTPAGIVELINKEINTGLADPRMGERLAALGGEVFASSPAEFGRFIAEETEKWRRVVRAVNIRI